MLLMSREIKFRAWHKNAKCMCMDVTTDLLNRDYLVFMQYTGLKDKNGKEIYEGDILERHEYWPIRIEYDKGCFMVRDLDKVRYNNLILNVPICNFESINDWKVIGNIYENPELLEGES